MKFLAGLFFAIAMLGGSAFAAADTPAPDAVVREMYETYFTKLTAAKDSNGYPDIFDQVSKYATPALAARLAKAKTSTEPVIDWDFLVDGQDWQDLKVLSVKATASDATSATVRIETSNSGTTSQSDVKMVKADKGWQVADIVFWPGKKESTTLDAVLKESNL